MPIVENQFLGIKFYFYILPRLLNGKFEFSIWWQYTGLDFVYDQEHCYQSEMELEGHSILWLMNRYWENGGEIYTDVFAY